MLVKVVVVFGLLFATLRIVGKLHNGSGGISVAGRKDNAIVQVLGRQSLGRNADVTVVAFGDRTLVLGVTEHNVSVVTELEPVAELPSHNYLEIPARTQESSPVPSWRELIESVRDRTVRH